MSAPLPCWRWSTANLGTATAEFAGIAAGAELLGVSRYLAVPVAAVAVSWLVLGGSFHRVEHVLMALAAVFVAYVGAGILAHPDWSAAFNGLVTPRMSFGHAGDADRRGHGRAPRWRRGD